MLNPRRPKVAILTELGAVAHRPPCMADAVKQQENSNGEK